MKNQKFNELLKQRDIVRRVQIVIDSKLEQIIDELDQELDKVIEEEWRNL